MVNFSHHTKLKYCDLFLLKKIDSFLNPSTLKQYIQKFGGGGGGGERESSVSQ